MSRQYFADVLTEPLGADFSTITATTETILVPTVLCPISALEGRAGKVYEFICGGTVTTGASGTLGLTPKIGSTIIGAIGPLQTTAVSVTTGPFICRAYIVVRSLGLPGANSTILSSCEWHSQGVVATASSETTAYQHGSLATADLSIANTFGMFVTFSTAPSVIPKWHLWRSLN